MATSGHFCSPPSVFTNSTQTLSQTYTFIAPKATDRQTVGLVVPVARVAGACVSFGAEKVREVWNEKTGEQGVGEFTAEVLWAWLCWLPPSSGGQRSWRGTKPGPVQSLQEQDQEGRPLECTYSLHTVGDRVHISI